MLDEIEAIDSYSSEVFRFVAWRQAAEVLAEMGLNTEDMESIRAALPGIVFGETPEDLLEDPFRRLNTGKTPQQSRFSDGLIRVFYSATEWQTSRDEALNWIYAKTTWSFAHYRLLCCIVTGRVKDLRMHIDRMPYLIADDGYPQCNQIAHAAINEQLHGLLTPSARRPTGTCVPVFRRDSLSRPNVGPDLFIFACDREMGTREVREIT